MVNVQSGDTIASTDNIAKGATTGNFTLSADGKEFTVEAAGLSGNCISVIAAGYSYSDPTAFYQGVLPYASSNDIKLDFPFDAPARIDVDSSFVIWVNYRTDA